MQWLKERKMKDKQWSIKHYTPNTFWVTRTPLQTGDECECFGRSSCSTNPSFNSTLQIPWKVLGVKSWTRKRRIKLWAANGTYPWSYVTQNSATIYYQENTDRKHLKIEICSQHGFKVNRYKSRHEADLAVSMVFFATVILKENVHLFWNQKYFVT
jgi:hypothetical protein